MSQASVANVLSYEKQAKFIQDRIISVEKNFGELCTVFGAYARKLARLRDSGDDLSKALQAYSNIETVNKSLSAGLSNLSTTLAAIEDYRSALVQRMEIKVISELSQYEAICRHARGEVKHTLSVRDGEIARKRTLDRIKERNPLSKQQIMQAEAELLKASADMNRTSKELEEQTDLFEKHKLDDMKVVMMNFVQTEMVFHSKCLELLTVGYQQVKNIDTQSDLKDFRSELTSAGSQNIKNSHGSLLSLLGGKEKTQPKRHDSTESIPTVSDEESEEEEESDERDSSPTTNKRNEHFN